MTAVSAAYRRRIESPGGCAQRFFIAGRIDGPSIVRLEPVRRVGSSELFGGQYSERLFTAYHPRQAIGVCGRADETFSHSNLGDALFHLLDDKYTTAIRACIESSWRRRVDRQGVN